MLLYCGKTVAQYIFIRNIPLWDYAKIGQFLIFSTLDDNILTGRIHWITSIFGLETVWLSLYPKKSTDPQSMLLYCGKNSRSIYLYPQYSVVGLCKNWAIFEISDVGCINVLLLRACVFCLPCCLFSKCFTTFWNEILTYIRMVQHRKDIAYLLKLGFHTFFH